MSIEFIVIFAILSLLTSLKVHKRKNVRTINLDLIKQET